MAQILIVMIMMIIIIQIIITIMIMIIMVYPLPSELPPTNEHNYYLWYTNGIHWHTKHMKLDNASHFLENAMASRTVVLDQN